MAVRFPLARSASGLLRVPGPHPLPLVGRTLNVIRFARDSVGYTRDLFRAYGPLVALAYGGGTNLYSALPNCPGTVFAYGPELTRQVTTQHELFYKAPLTSTLHPLGKVPERLKPLQRFGTGLFGVNSDTHRQHRRLLMPAFHKRRIEGYRDDMVAIARSELDGWRVGEQRNIAEAMRLITLRIATKTLFGEDMGHEGGIGQHIQDVLAIGGSPLTTRLRLDVPGTPYHRLLNLVEQLDNDTRSWIARKRAAGANGADLLSMLIQARDEESGVALTEDEVIGHAGVIFGAGHETSSNALTWTLFLLAQHPQIAADLLDELDGELHGEAPTLEQLPKLPLLEHVIKESMRVLPPVPWNGRVTAQLSELGGHQLPQGTEVFVSIYQTHHMPELYANPERFYPRRWETISPSIFEYNPFSAGPRMCIGATFAMLEIKLVLAMLLQRFRLEATPGTQVDRFGVIVMSPRQGIPLTIRAQDRQFTRGVGGVRGNVREMVALP